MALGNVNRPPAFRPVHPAARASQPADSWRTRSSAGPATLPGDWQFQISAGARIPARHNIKGPASVSVSRTRSAAQGFRGSSAVRECTEIPAVTLQRPAPLLPFPDNDTSPRNRSRGWRRAARPSGSAASLAPASPPPRMRHPAPPPAGCAARGLRQSTAYAMSPGSRGPGLALHPTRGVAGPSACSSSLSSYNACAAP